MKICAVLTIGESMSAGRLYDKIEDMAIGTVLYVLPQGVLCVLDHKENRGKQGQPVKVE